MAQYTHTSFAAAATIVSSPNSGINNELRTIAAAHNLHAAADISTTGSVQNAALICNQSFFSMVMTTSTSISGPSTASTVRAYCVVPVNCQLVAGYACTISEPAAGDQQTYIYKEGTTDELVFAPAAMSGVYDVVKMNPVMTTLSAGDVLTMRVVFATTANTSGMNICTLLAKTTHD